MRVDVTSEAIVVRPRAEVFAFAADPRHAPRWYVNIKEAEWKTEPMLALGSRFEFVAHFLGRRMVYTYEVTELIPDERLTMRTVDGPFPMETTYTFADHPAGTKMTLRNHGHPRGFSLFAAPVIAAAMRRANRKDLKRLKHILECGVIAADHRTLNA